MSDAKSQVPPEVILTVCAAETVPGSMTIEGNGNDGRRWINNVRKLTVTFDPYEAFNVAEIQFVESGSDEVETVYATVRGTLILHRCTKNPNEEDGE